ncbi:Retrovirus-related Pol polyprotein from transposon gypsy [Eumeta japonica]|uniref:RNA-directed DNA polymerase n=1 Tax=Eumeta variegata TaxID=151549 RepID=A0A4C1TPL9_EUMVA|nr:Retrovirus-related Pol polyprotein from transposon gypsy [Eumeta japonica]
MPFGLKNAPSIFQRCVDDILRSYIGKFAYVYIDDVLIYSSTPEEHIEHIEAIVNALHKANMKISNEKSHFFKEEIEYLGHVIKHNGITVDPTEIQTIRDYPKPTTLKELRSSLGLASYYRKFIKNFAAIVKPLTTFLRGENNSISKNQSAKIKIELDQPALEAMNRIKDELEAQVQLFQPDFKEPFELTTDASNFAIGAVLSQKQRLISFISRTLNETEQNYSTNEK